MLQQRVAINDLKRSLHDPNFDGDAWRKQKELDAINRELDAINQEKKRERRLQELADYEEKKDMEYREDLAQFQELQRKLLNIAENITKPKITPTIINLPPPPPPQPIYYNPPPQAPPAQYYPQAFDKKSERNYLPNPDEFESYRSMTNMSNTKRTQGKSGKSSRREKEQIDEEDEEDDVDDEDRETAKSKTKRSGKTEKTESKISSKTGKSKTNPKSSSKGSKLKSKIEEASEEEKDSNNEEEADEEEATKKFESGKPSGLKSSKNQPKVSKTESKTKKTNTKKNPTIDEEISPRMDFSEMRPEPFNQQEDDIAVFIKRGHLLPDNVNASKIFVNFYNESSDEVYETYDLISTIDSDIYNPYYGLPIRIPHTVVKQNPLLRMYIMLLTIEEVAGMTSRNKKIIPGIFGISLFPLFIEGDDHLPASAPSSVTFTYQPRYLNSGNYSLPIYYPQYSEQEPQELFAMMKKYVFFT